MSNAQATSTGLTAQQQFLNDLWDEHIRHEFDSKNTAATIDTMVPDACVTPSTKVFAHNPHPCTEIRRFTERFRLTRLSTTFILTAD